MQLIILFGGASYEHEISIVSATTLKEKLQDHMNLEFVFCDVDHTLYHVHAKDMKAKTFSSGQYKKFAKLTLARGKFQNVKLFSKTELHGIVLNLIHGGDGEDGTIASLLDFYEIKYIGPRIDASVFSYDKRYTKWFAAARGVKTLEYETLHADEHKDTRFSFPVIIKPARLGSSIGVSVVRSVEEFDYALDVAFEFDNTVIVEPFIEGVKEYNLAGYFAHGEIHYSMIEEPQKTEFLDFEKKYMDFSRTESAHEATLDENMQKRLKENFKAIYRDMFEGALIRCDFFVIKDEVYLNEINPIPGSMANYLFKDFPKAIEALADSLPHRKRPKVTYEYIHSISQAKGK